MASTEIDTKSIILQSFQTNQLCSKVSLNDVDGYIYVKPEDIHIYSLYNFLQSNQHLYSFKDIQNTNNIYTYILFQYTNPITKIQDYYFYARPVYTVLESFAKHETIYNIFIYKHYGIEALVEYLQKSKENYDLLYNFDSDNLSVLFAGEIQMKGSNTIRYNFLSGTFMRSRFEDIDYATKQYYILSMESIFRHIGFEGRLFYDETLKTYIQSNDFESEIQNIWSNLKDSNAKPKMYILPDFTLCKNLNKLFDMKLTYTSRVNMLLRSFSKSSIPTLRDYSMKQIVEIVKEEMKTDTRYDEFIIRLEKLNNDTKYDELVKLEEIQHTLDKLYPNVLDYSQSIYNIGTKRKRVGGYRKTIRKKIN